MSLAEQALFLLDILPSIQSRNKLENFSDLDQTITASLPGTISPAETAAKIAAEPNPFHVASRMSRSNYEDQARAEALTQALRQIRASNASKSSGARSSGRT